MQWMTAGRGVSHAEMFPLTVSAEEVAKDPPDSGFSANAMKFYQLWLNLPRKNKMCDPAFKMLWGETVPVLRGGEGGSGSALEATEGAAVTVVAGTMPGAPAPPTPPPDSWASEPASAVRIWVIRLAAADDRVTLPAEADAKGINRQLLFVSGPSVIVDGRSLSTPSEIDLDAGEACVVAHGGGGVGEVEALLLQGRAIGEPVVQHGPFVGNTREDIAKAFEDYRSGSFGLWPWKSSQPILPLKAGRHAILADGTEDRPPTE